MCNNNQRAAAQARLYRERLERIANACGLPTNSPLGAEWVLSHMKTDIYRALSDKDLIEEAAMYYMVHRLSTYEYVVNNDLPQKLTYLERARMMIAMRYGKDWSVDKFECALNNYSLRLKKSKGAHSN